MIQKSIELSRELNKDIAPGFETFVARSLLNGPDTNNWTYVTKNNEHIPVKLCVTAIFDESEKCIGYLSVAEILN